ncbi:hypothetical protein SAMD00023378_1788 [Ralstonia sp. NT80]|nr:hypothetical protein SAMD00023378_1788 [Ralstonia sp. NT80]
MVINKIFYNLPEKKLKPMPSINKRTKKSEATFINYLIKKVVPLFIVWLGVLLAILAAPLVVPDAMAQDARGNFAKFADWKSLVIVVLGGVIGSAVFRITAAWVSNEQQDYRKWYGNDIAQEIIGAVLNVSMAAVFAKCLGAPWGGFLLGLTLIFVCFGAWKSYCFTD